MAAFSGQTHRHASPLYLGRVKSHGRVKGGYSLRPPDREVPISFCGIRFRRGILRAAINPPGLRCFAGLAARLLGDSSVGFRPANPHLGGRSVDWDWGRK